MVHYYNSVKCISQPEELKQYILVLHVRELSKMSNYITVHCNGIHCIQSCIFLYHLVVLQMQVFQGAHQSAAYCHNPAAAQQQGHILAAEGVGVHILAAEGVRVHILVVEGVVVHVLAAVGVGVHILAVEGVGVHILAAEGVGIHILVVEGVGVHILAVEGVGALPHTAVALVGVHTLLVRVVHLVVVGPHTPGVDNLVEVGGRILAVAVLNWIQNITLF